MELARLIKLPERDLRLADVGYLNVFCGTDLPGTCGLDRNNLLPTLDAWTGYIGRNIERWWPDYLRNPQEGEGSPGKFRMASLATLVQRELRVGYNLPFTDGDYDGRDARNLFLQGPLSGFGGTCITLAVLYLSIGRRLGYPLSLVKTKDHYLVRWEEPSGERFNVECACRGFLSWSEAEVRCGDDLRHLTPREELAQFLNERGNCLVEHLRMREAVEAYDQAQEFAPQDNCIRGNQVVADMIHRTLQGTMEDSFCWSRQVVAFPGFRFPEPRDSQEMWALPHVRETLARIMRNRAKDAAGEHA
jgi:hypothetical protein